MIYRLQKQGTPLCVPLFLYRIVVRQSIATRLCYLDSSGIPASPRKMTAIEKMTVSKTPLVKLKANPCMLDITYTSIWLNRKAQKIVQKYRICFHLCLSNSKTMRRNMPILTHRYYFITTSILL
jgi:hypothetical protein